MGIHLSQRQGAYKDMPLLHLFSETLVVDLVVFLHCRCEDNGETRFTNSCTQFFPQPRRHLLELGQWQVAVNFPARQMPLRSQKFELSLAVLCAIYSVTNLQTDVTTTDRKWLPLSP